MNETWYVMTDGTSGDPALIGTTEDGLLVHEDGRRVAYGPHGPLSRGCVDVDAERAAYQSRELRPEQPRRGYKTRGAKD